MNKVNWPKYGFEFLSIFVALIAAFALNNWNDNRKDRFTESKILAEISNGLKQDIADIRTNIQGHHNGIAACRIWRDAIINHKVLSDSIAQYYSNLTRDFISIQNTSGYETLKSKGLEMLKTDSLRSAIISLYEIHHNTLRKLEEEYVEMQFQKIYFSVINDILAEHFTFDNRGNLKQVDLSGTLSDINKNKLLIYLWKIQLNRNFILALYADIENKINRVLEMIEKELNQ